MCFKNLNILWKLKKSLLKLESFDNNIVNFLKFPNIIFGLNVNKELSMESIFEM